MNPRRRYLVLTCSLLAAVIGGAIFLHQRDNGTDDVRQGQTVPGIPQAEKAGGRKTSEGESAKKDFLTPVEAERMMAEALAVKDIRQRSKACADIVRRLCESGHVDEAFALIQPALGSVRQFQIETFFTHCGLDLHGAVEKMKALTLRMDGFHGMGAFLAANVKTGDLNAVLESTEFKGFLPSIQQDLPASVSAVERVLSGYLLRRTLASGTAEEVAALIAAGRGLRDAGKITDRGLAVAIEGAKSMNPFEKWSVFSSSINEITAEEGDVGRVREKIAEDMVRADAQAALNEIVKMNTTQGLAALENAVRNWSLIDNAAPPAWFDVNRNRLSSPQRDAVVKAYFNMALTYAESDTALLWARQLEDGGSRREALDKLAGLQKQ